MIDKAFAEHFAADWIAAWNSHDLARVLSHYADDFEMSSPYIVQIAGEASGTLKGKDKVGQYWNKALILMPNLHFELQQVLVGTNSITLLYQSSGRLAAEVLQFDREQFVIKASAHYPP